jgi:hypothetical protein
LFNYFDHPQPFLPYRRKLHAVLTSTNADSWKTPFWMTVAPALDGGLLCKISGSHGGEYEDDSFLGHNAV